MTEELRVRKSRKLYMKIRSAANSKMHWTTSLLRVLRNTGEPTGTNQFEVSRMHPQQIG